jgi:uncharacterized Tic20 family protein
MARYSPDPPPDRLVADSEREPIIEILRRGYTDGRLNQNEFDQRLSTALAARTHGQLATVLSGLPEAERPPGPPVSAGPAADGRSSAATAHALGIITSFVGPLIIFLIEKNNVNSFARTQAVEALNFQLSLLLVTIVTLGFGGVLWPVSWVFCIIAAVNAGDGQPYRYPLSLRFIR